MTSEEVAELARIAKAKRIIKKHDNKYIIYSSIQRGLKSQEFRDDGHIKVRFPFKLDIRQGGVCRRSFSIFVYTEGVEIEVGMQHG